MLTLLSGLLIFLSLIFSVAAFAGLIAPKLFKDRKTGEVPSRLQMFGGGTAAALITAALGAALSPDDTGAAENESKTELAAAQAAAESSEPLPPSEDYKQAMPFTFSEWRDRANEAISNGSTSMPIPLSLKPSGNKKSINYTAAHTLRDGLQLMAAARPDNGKITAITLIAAPGGKEPAAIMGIMTDAAAVLAACDTADDRKLPGRLLKTIIDTAQKFAKNPEKDANASLTHNGVKYSVMISQHIGMMMFAEPEKTNKPK